MLKNFLTLTQAAFLTTSIIIIALTLNILLTFIGIDVAGSPWILWLNIPVFAAVIIFAVKKSSTKLSDFIRFQALTSRFLVGVILSFIGVMIIVSDCANLVYYIFPVSVEFIEMMDIIGSSSSGIFAAIIVAPLTEEVFFRGLILRGLLKNYSMYPSIIFSAILFGALHVNVWQMIPAIIIGIYLSWLYLISNNLGVVLVLHGVQNSIFSFLESRDIIIQGFVYNLKDGIQFQPFWLDISGAVFFIAGYLILKNIELTQGIDYSV